MKLFNKPETYLFVYTQSENQDFWIYANGSYHRMLWKQGIIRYVRAQAQLPPYATGSCLQVNQAEREILQKQAGLHGLRLRFASSPEECYPKDTPLSAGYVFDSTPSTYYFFFDGNMERRDQRGESR